MQSNKQLRREAKLLFRFCLVRGMLDEVRVIEAVRKVLEAKRRGRLALLAHFRRLVKLERLRQTAEVESAVSLPAALQACVLSDVERLYGSGISTSFVLNPALIGGMRIQVGSDVYDGSVRAGLDSLQKSF
ncbi:MAG: FoF1 ATP synthase subunit delta [Terracidiphilus sp.]